MKKITTIMMMGLLAACGSDNTDGVTSNNAGEKQAVAFNIEVERVSDATRAVTYTTVADLEAAGSFACFAYIDGTTTPYFNAMTVNYANGAWSFATGQQAWPNETLNFLALMPAVMIATDPTQNTTPYAYTAYSEDTPQMTVTNLPLNIVAGTDQTPEMAYAYAPTQSKAGQGEDGVTLRFRHPMARVIFQLMDETGGHARINSVTIPDIYSSGTCTVNGQTHAVTWLTSGTTDNLVVRENTTTEAPATGDDAYLVIPHNYGTKTITVNASWSEWAEVENRNVSTTVDINWQPGYSYTYTFRLTKNALTVDTNEFTEQW